MVPYRTVRIVRYIIRSTVPYITKEIGDKFAKKYDTSCSYKIK